MSEYIDIAKIGERIYDLEKPKKFEKIFSGGFHWMNHSYKLLLEDISVRTLLKDVHNVPEFNIQSRSDGSLWLTYSRQELRHSCPTSRYLNSLNNLVETFFIVKHRQLMLADDSDDENDKNEGNEDNNDTDGCDSGVPRVDEDIDDKHLPTTFINMFYEKLRAAHECAKSDGQNCSNETVQHKDLRPILTQYQVDGIRWMLNREKYPRFYRTEFRPIDMRFHSNVGHTFFFNERTIQIKIDRNDHIAIPSGGILADAMGLGKTVEMLALILLNQRIIDIPMTANDVSMAANGNDCEQVIRCLCPATTVKSLVVCNGCQLYQHRGCVGQFNNAVTLDSNYYCPYCWKQRVPLQVKTTFIVSPPSIKMQWYDEIIKHISNPDFKVFVYAGMKKESKKWISPHELGSYDVVLTDYSTLQAEFHFTDPNPSDRQLRHPARYINARSPLLSVDWWRICLDEAQMVSSAVTIPSKLVAKLPSIHRWAVTGTPIEKSMDDLFGLLSFLKCAPYDERSRWLSVLYEFYYRIDAQLFVKILEPIMWRTCKSKAIMTQINIPEQGEVIHLITMSDLEYFHYNKEHRKRWDHFHENTRKVHANSQLVGLNPHTFKKILEPLRRLRQGCSIHRVGHINNLQTVQQDELLKHLCKKTETEAKSELRTITSSLNGLAALHIIQKNPIDAAKMYRGVLKWASDYTDRITVDSLLQIHATYNLLEIDQSIAQDERQVLSTSLNQLEAKYLQSSVALVNKHQLELEKSRDKFEQIDEDFQENEYQWWIDILYKEIDNPTNLITKITDEVQGSYGHDKMERIRDCFISLRTVSVMLTNWLDKIMKQHTDIRATFDKLRLYTEHFKPIAEVDEQMRKKLTTFLDHTYSCHLYAIRSNASAPNKRKKISLCLLCETKRELDEYEALIFDKDLVENSNTVHGETSRGSWRASYQESILRIISMHRQGGKPKNDAKLTMDYLEALKNEFKEYSRLWADLNNAVAAYDEIKMCKSRTEAIDPSQETHSTNLALLRSNLIISLFEAEPNMMQLQSDKRAAELNFVRKLGQLKYLSHLEQSEMVEECPVCKTIPADKYFVFECGHHMCALCYTTWIRQHDGVFNCVVCRYSQRQDNVYHVSTTKIERITTGSSKIEEITQQVVRLRKEDPTVKIVIFSQWSIILANLGEAFSMNGIIYRKDLSHFSDTVREFKNPDLGVTCLLLPISYGAKGLNLTEATHVFFVEPILSPGDELQAIGRIHRIGQTKKTYVHRFIVKSTIEEAIYKTISNDQSDLWMSQKFTIESLMALFTTTDIVVTELDQQ